MKIIVYGHAGWIGTQFVELLQKEKFLFSEDGSELLIKGSVDQVVKIKIISETEIKLQTIDMSVIDKVLFEERLKKSYGILADGIPEIMK